MLGPYKRRQLHISFCPAYTPLGEQRGGGEKKHLLDIREMQHFHSSLCKNRISLIALAKRARMAVSDTAN